MLMILNAIFGFAAPFLPELLRWFQDKDDKAHELAMFKLQMDYAQLEHTMKLEEMNAEADIQEATVLHQAAPSYGVQLLDAAEKWAESGWGKALITPAFYLFTLTDFVSEMVKPSITYAAIGFYMWYKYALLQLNHNNVLAIWTDTDFGVVMLVLSYWFGHRAAKAAFGGNATNGLRGQ